jgi:hypothetical protein
MWSFCCLFIGMIGGLDGSSLRIKKTARPCVEPRGPSSGRNHVRQSFSRFRLIAPRLNLRSGSHLRPCLVAPTINGASLEHPDSAIETAPAALCTLAAQERVTNLRLPTSLGLRTSFNYFINHWFSEINVASCPISGRWWQDAASCTPLLTPSSALRSILQCQPTASRKLPKE